MTDPGAAADKQHPGATETGLPDSAGDPQTEVPGSPHDHTDASSQRISKDLPACGSAFGTEASAFRSEMVSAFHAGQIYGLTRSLDRFAQDLAQARAGLLASALTKVSIADYALPTRVMQRAISKMVMPPDLGLFKINQSAVSLAASFPAPSLTRHISPAAHDLGFQLSIHRMVNSNDHGLLGINQQLTKTAAAFVASHQELICSMASLRSIRAAAARSLMNFAAPKATAGLTDLFRSWRETAETGLGLLRGLARAAYRAALRARAAVLNGDDRPVAWFIETWLHMHVTPERIQAVSAALLERGWDVGIPENPAYLLSDLRNRTARQARALRPIWETQLNYRTIGSLDHTVTTSNGTLLTVADLVANPQTTEDLILANELEEQRIRRVLTRLKPDELHVTNVYAERSELTWAEAAHLAGAADPAAMGERVRRKLKRLGAEHTRRLVQTSGA